jgi:hypothetical protein
MGEPQVSLMSALGQSRHANTANGFAGCPLCSESDLNDASQRNDALCHKPTLRCITARLAACIDHESRLNVDGPTIALMLAFPPRRVPHASQ